MSEKPEKSDKPEKAEKGSVVKLLNRGRRHFDILVSEEPRKVVRVSPGEVVEVSEDVAKKLAVYKDLVDASKLTVRSAGSAAADAKLKAANDALAKENEELKKQLAAKK